MMNLFKKIFAVAFFLLNSVFICSAAPFAACNHTLDADYIRSGGGNYGSIQCDTVGELTIGSKVYQIFEYAYAGYGQVVLGAMAPGYKPEPTNFEHILDITLAGLNNDFHAANLSDNEKFAITIKAYKADETEQEQLIFSSKIAGKCQKIYDDKGKERSKDLESCRGADWSLTVAPKPRTDEE